MAVRCVAEELTTENLKEWTSRYTIPDHPENVLNAGVIMAGNIPLVGFHDFISVLITGNRIIAKPSTRDEDLISFISKLLIEINPEFNDRIEFRKGYLSDFNLVIATGSNNSSRYFEYYFGKYPHIIRKNRNSVAILEGDETDKELKMLGTDVFSYFGLGCRNISKIFIPSGFDIEKLAAAWSSFSSLPDHTKYANNYDFYKAVFLVNKESFKDLGFLLLKESADLFSPVAVLNYEYYSSIDEVRTGTELERDKIQCIIGRKYLQFGTSQSPKLWDYADGIDTVEFLLKKNGSGIL
jgi:hypothetical protein